ncbi:MAG: glycoside hydrolase family 32 protein [Actinomycetota bacterium]|nr:glycoside hydrolase family 32 protein [Actinomycetota bacterium]
MASAHHLRPRRGWLNDPNGMLRRDGRWHVFFQHNPARAEHGDIHWGHASSRDLVSWLEHPVAFGPTPSAPDAAGCWSGVALDLGARVAAVYTACALGPRTTTVCIRYAADAELDVWSPPVVVAHQHDVPSTARVREMRDPFLFEAGGRRWALLGAGIGDLGTGPAQWSPALLLWSCDDLERWRFERVWLDDGDTVLGAPSAGPANIWECPQLVDVDGLAVLLVSLWLRDELTGVAQAIGELTVGDDGVPALALQTLEPFDTGDACYAPQVAMDEEGPWALGWVKQDAIAPWTHPDAVAGCLTLPRRPRREGQHVWWEADRRTQALVGPSVEPDGPIGRSRALPAAARVVLDPSGGPARLSRGDLVVELGAGTTVWVDDDVVEAYPPNAAPATHRAPGPDPWVLEQAGAPTPHVRSLRPR